MWNGMRDNFLPLSRAQPARQRFQLRKNQALRSCLWTWRLTSTMSEIETLTTNDLGGPRFSQHLLITEGEQTFRNMKNIWAWRLIISRWWTVQRKANGWRYGIRAFMSWANSTETNATAHALTGKFGGCHGVADNNYLEMKKILDESHDDSASHRHIQTFDWICTQSSLEKVPIFQSSSLVNTMPNADFSTLVRAWKIDWEQSTTHESIESVLNTILEHWMSKIVRMDGR